MRLPCGETALAVAVLGLAVADLKRGDKQALVWWKECHEMVEFWCDALNLDWEMVRDRALSGVIASMPSHPRSGKRKSPEPEPNVEEDEQLELSFWA